MSIRTFKSTAFAPIAPSRSRLTGYEYHAFPSDNPSCHSPIITTNPVGFTIDEGSNGSMFIDVSGTPKLTFQWEVSTDSGANWGDVVEGGVYVGSTARRLDVIGATAGMDSYQFRCSVSNSCGSVTSTAATISITSSLAPIAWWKMATGLGDICPDWSPNVLDGNFPNGVTWTSGHDIGQFAIALNGLDQYAVATNPDAPLELLGDLTICAWVNTVSGGSMAIMSRVDATDYGYMLGMNAGHLRFFAGSVDGFAPGSYRNSAQIISDGNWHFVSVTVSGAAVKFYVDGALVTTVAGWSTNSVSTNPWSIGALHYGGFSQYFDGNIQDVRVYNQVLTDQQVNDVYTGTLNPI